MIKKCNHGYVTSILLIFFLLCAKTPFSSLNNADPFRMNELSGAVYSVRNLVQSADNPQDFFQNFQQAVTALKIAAGITSRITSEIPVSFSQPLGPHLVSSSNDSSIFPHICRLVLNPAPSIQSIISTPPLRPPLTGTI
jgi:hypothetical protein